MVTEAESNGGKVHICKSLLNTAVTCHFYYDIMLLDVNKLLTNV